MKKLDVYLADTPDDERRIGQLAEANRTIYFEYDPAFLRDPLWLSPFKLPPEPGLHEHRDRAFGPLFGLFDDSLPDGWGLLLMDRWLTQNRIDPATASPLDRLAFMGTRAMGALVYRPPVPAHEPVAEALDLHDMAGEAYNVQEGNCSDLLPQLMATGGSPGGARPKVLVGINGDRMISGADALPDGWDGWIVKFHAKRDAVDDGRIEYAYSLMARAAGLPMQPTRLFTTPQGEAFFGTQRFDRRGPRRVHVHTFGNLIHSNFRIPGCDYLQLLKTTRVLTRNQTDVETAFRLMAFNILAHNRDDHVKNFAFMLNEHKDWRMTPAYDLTFARGPGGEHTMSVAGEGQSPQSSHLFRVANESGIPRQRAVEIIDAVTAAVSNWPEFADQAGLCKKTTQRISIELA
jgi:serine/threonine-protein kinase HipA